MSRTNLPEIVGVCFVALCGCLAILGWPQWSDELSQTVAAWFQAVFSVIAILAGAAFVWWQHKLERIRERESRIDERVHAFEPIVGLVIQAQWQLSHIHDAYIGKVSPDDLLGSDVIVDDVAFLLQAMEQVPVHEIPTTYLCSYFMDGRRLLVITLAQLRRAVYTWRESENPERWKSQISMAPEGSAAMQSIKTAFVNALADIGAGRQPTHQV